MTPFTLHELQCFDAVVRCGGFQAAADSLHRSHPAVFAAVGKLERQLGLTLLDRSGYRVQPTGVGRAFHRHARNLLQEMERLRLHAAQLAIGEESELGVVIGDLCPRPEALTLLGRFFAQSTSTRINLHCESVRGPWERLFADEADLILHRVDKSDPRIEWMDLGSVPFLPVVAPDFLPFPVGPAITPEQMRDFTQCVIRDSARQSDPVDYFIIEGAHQCTVPDQLIKKDIILHGMAWGHMPLFLIEDELRRGQLISIEGRHLPGTVEELVAARRRDRPHGPVAERLWRYLDEHSTELRKAVQAA
ncbi:LysR family transcriptional regulator [Gilvimarinus sp. F26214L]|uniref:LysR family transcriptional regulator n=1 Tax=Gilvimarinus sp. DZF01 TaxID=3461371 RepID=UPI0040457654